MRGLALDLSTSTGFALLDGEVGGDLPVIIDRGTIALTKIIREYGKYPFSYYLAAADMASQIIRLVESLRPAFIVVEETNLSRFSRYSQKALEFIHCLVLQKLHALGDLLPPIYYISSSVWRCKLKLSLSKDQRKANAALSKASREAKKRGMKLDKIKLGIARKTTQKHIAIDLVNKTFGLALKPKDNDQADAICLVWAHFAGAEHCDGVK